MTKGRFVAGLLRLATACLVAAAALLHPADTAAQTRADSAAVLLDAARRFELERRGDIAGALYEMILLRYGDTPAADAVRGLRASGDASLDRSGRTELLVWSTTYGFWLGAAFPLMLDADDPEAYGLGLLVGGPAGFLAARAYTRNRPISGGQARAITWGGIWGTWQGLGIVEALDIGEGEVREFCPPSGEPCFGEVDADNGTEIVAGMVIGGVGGIVAGALLARKPISQGTGATVSLGSLWGTGYGASIGYLAGLRDDELLLAALIGGNTALVGSAIGQRTWQLTESRARLISIAGLAGALAGLGLALLTNVDDDETAVLLPTLGGTAGLIFGVARTRGMDRPSGMGGEEQPPGAGALLEVRAGRLGIGTPAPQPYLLRGGTRSSVAVYLPVLNARF